MPDRPAATHCRTRPSQSWPAATLTSTTGPAGPSLAAPTSKPANPACTTVPGNPSSATTRLLPPPRTSTGSAARSAARTALTSSSSLPAAMKRAAGPPRRSVVWSASSTRSVVLTISGSRNGNGATPGSPRSPGRGRLALRQSSMPGRPDRTGPRQLDTKPRLPRPLPGSRTRNPGRRGLSPALAGKSGECGYPAIGLGVAVVVQVVRVLGRCRRRRARC